MRKLRTARLLMLATILLVVAFQVYWLGKLYNQEYDNLKRTTDVLFKETLYELQLSRFENDSLFPGPPPSDLFTRNFVRVMKFDNDSMVKGRKSSVIISMNEERTTFNKDSVLYSDSSKRFDFSKDSTHNKFMQRFRLPNVLKDSLPAKSVDSSYRIALAKANITLPYTLKISGAAVKEDACDGDFCTSLVPVGLFKPLSYKASFSDARKFLFARISMQALLSVLLAGLTIISFVFIYRNLLSEKKLSDIKNEFISNITHELKTPLATVSVAIEAMKNFNALQNPARTKEYLDIADNELQRLSLLVDKVLKLSMFEQEQVELNFERVNIFDIAKEVLGSMRIQFEKRKATVDLHNEGSVSLMGDRLHITSMIYNLVDNALKYTMVTPVINIAVTGNASGVQLMVSDNGIGIDPEYKGRIFEKFFRVPGGNKHNVKGYGLGLSYVAHIVAKHSGEVTVESMPGNGTKFIIQLPKNDEEA